jgi:NADH:ubiquinone oxidoreductase subunit F (NADH-binding)
MSAGRSIAAPRPAGEPVRIAERRGRRATPAATVPVGGLPRLLATLADGARVDLDRHLDAYGPMPNAGELDAKRLLETIERAGLNGRGGAGFPMAAKIRAVRAARGRAIVVANGCESEPISAKDALLLRELPHLVLDGAELAARAVGAPEAIVAFETPNRACRASLERALSERRAARLDATSFTLFAAQERFLSGQETALVSQINGGPPRPTFVGRRPSERGVARRPTLIQNVETLANLALLARYGAEWYRRLGTAAESGSRLITLLGGVARPGVYEVEAGTPMRTLFAAAGGLDGELAGVLVGGYFGSWLLPQRLDSVELSNESLARHGAALGCGAVVALPATSCPVAETVRVAIYLATETAGQCGPCVHGSAAIARTLHGIAEGRAPSAAFADLTRWTTELPGRGACHHPNGLAHLVATALAAFGPRFEDHARHGACDACARGAVLPVPQPSLAAA